jgi:hypothetical protein
MARGISDGEENRLVETPRFLESVLAPGPPVNGIILMLLEIGARFFAQPI